MRVVVVGGGVAGHLVCKALQNEHDVVLVDPRDHLAIPLAAPRTLVDPSFGERALVPYTDFLPRVNQVQGRATRVDLDGVTVSTDTGDEHVTGDFIVLATGARYPKDRLLLPQTPTVAGRRAEQAAFASRLASAKRVLIVGGGPVGVEVAGEILHAHPSIELTLVHAGPSLLPGTSAKPGRYAAQWLAARGAQVVLNDRVGVADDAVGQAFEGQTNGGVAVQADICLRFVGYKPDLSYLQLGDVLDDNGLLGVRDTLQLRRHDHVFALGDITDLPERKLAMYAAKHADVASQNIRDLAAGELPSRRYEPKTGDNTMLVTLGPKAGVGHLPTGPFRNAAVARWLKSGDMMVGKYRRRIGLSR